MKTWDSGSGYLLVFEDAYMLQDVSLGSMGLGDLSKYVGVSCPYTRVQSAGRKR